MGKSFIIQFYWRNEEQILKIYMSAFWVNELVQNVRTINFDLNKRLKK